MDSYVEVWTDETPGLVALAGNEITLGRADSNDIAIAADESVSRLHAVLEQTQSGWRIRDLSSSNGTQVNGTLITTETRLDDGDEIVLGDTRLVFRSNTGDSPSPTINALAPPAVTHREKEVLVALCQPLIDSTETYRQASAIKTIAEQLVLSEEAVTFHLANLYDKFEIHDATQSRRVSLANEAIRRRAVTQADLVPHSDWSNRTRL